MKPFTLIIAIGLSLCFTGVAHADLDGATKQLAHDIFKQLIEINTTDSVGSTTIAAEAMAKRLRNAGFPEGDIKLLGPNDRKGNLVARIHGTGGHKPILFIGHLDVVEAKREDWSTDPFQFVEKDGYYYGRGTVDMKNGDAALVTTFIRLHKEGYKPDRDLILALTADEEIAGPTNGIDWLLKNHRNLIDADFVINADGGGVVTKNFKPTMMNVNASEKLYADFQLEVKNAGGHSSLPTTDNAIYHLTDGLSRLGQYRFPFELSEVTRAFFERRAKIETGQIAIDMLAITKDKPPQDAIDRLTQDPTRNATVRTTCVATRLEGGHANNALPQIARATVNCRILPGHSREEVRQELLRVLNDPKIVVRDITDPGEPLDISPGNTALPPVPLRTDIMRPLEATTAKLWPGLPVISDMATGASDSFYTNAAGLPTYLISGVAVEDGDFRAHGKDERIQIDSFYKSVEFYYEFVKALAPQK